MFAWLGDVLALEIQPVPMRVGREMDVAWEHLDWVWVIVGFRDQSKIHVSRVVLVGGSREKGRSTDTF